MGPAVELLWVFTCVALLYFGNFIELYRSVD